MVTEVLHLKQKIVLKLRRLLLQIMSSKNQSKYPMLFSYDIPQADNVYRLFKIVELVNEGR